MPIINNSQKENMRIKEEIEHYNRKVSVLNEFKNYIEKHLSVERVEKINKKLEQKKSYYSEQKFKLLTDKPDALTSNNLAMVMIVLIAVGALGYFSSLYYSNHGNDFTGFSVSNFGNESNSTGTLPESSSYQTSGYQASGYGSSSYETSGYTTTGAACENPPTSCGCTLTQSASLTQNFNCANTHGMIINGGNYTLDCNGNSLNSTNKSGGSYYGIYFNGTDTNNITVKNCLIVNWSAGIFIDTTAGSDNKILDNTIRNSSGGGSTYGIYISSSNNNNLISGNKIYYPGFDGIYITSSDNNNITNNLLIGSTAESLYLSRTNNTLVFNNTFAAASSYGLFIYEANYT